MKAHAPLTNRILAVDDDALIIGEYLHCLGSNFEPDAATSTLGDLEKVLFGEETDEKGAAKFDVHTRTQGAAGVEAGTQIRRLDPEVQIVFVTGYSDIPRDELERRVPPPVKLHYFNKPLSFLRLAEDVAGMVRHTAL